mmetsp:Transcript_7513/g.9491  ORF Transcript_7513/g.9491 Transcript_7513/m.9491 type:complete len:239 (+) Transcript_7513:30-746(+)
MSKVPVLTIPESAYDPSTYTLSPHQYSGRKSKLLAYLIKLTHGSAITLSLAYIIGLFVLKPLMETTANRRYELLEQFRGKLRDCYLNLIGRVNYIPIVAINKNDGSGKLYADAICQTNDSYLDSTSYKTISEQEEELNKNDKLFQDRLTTRLTRLATVLKNCEAYRSEEIPSYKTVNFALKDFQDKADLTYFNSNELFTATADNTDSPNGSAPRKRNLAVDTKNEIRSIKGLFMSGQV